jgi:MFS family permease
MTGDVAPQPADVRPPEPADQHLIRPLDAAPKWRLIAVLAMLVVFGEVVPFQYTMIGLITPLVARSFPAAGDGVSWMVTIIGLVGGGTMALVAKMADLWGKKRILLAASVLFLAGSLLCATTAVWPLFLVGRGCEAVALGMSAICYSLVRDIFPRSWIPIAVGFIATGFGLSSLLGPLVGGVLADHYGWRAIFWFLVIYMVVTIPLFAAIVPESVSRVRQRLDLLGATLVGVGLAGVLVYVSEGGTWGWSAPGSFAYLIGGLVALGLFVLWETRAKDPIVDLRLLREPRLAMIVTISFFATAALGLASYLPAYMFQTSGNQVKQAIIAAAAQRAHLPATLVARGISFHGDVDYAKGFSLLSFTLHIALWISIASMIAGPLGGVWTRRVGPRLPLITGLASMLLAFVGLTFLDGYWQWQAFFGVFIGIGIGLFYASSQLLVMGVVPREQQAISAGMVAAFGAVGTAFAVAVATAVLAGHPFQVLATTPNGQRIVSDIPQVYTSGGFGLAYLVVGVGATVIALLIALALRIGRRPGRVAAASPPAT